MAALTCDTLVSYHNASRRQDLNLNLHRSEGLKSRNQHIRLSIIVQQIITKFTSILVLIGLREISPLVHKSE
jgi:hypothetical protein